MAVSSIISSSALTQLYYGLSADTKPSAGVQAFALFMETDTGNVFEYSGGQWTKIVSGGAARVYGLAANAEAIQAATEYAGLYIAVAGTVTGTPLNAGAPVSFLNVPVGFFPVHFSAVTASPANTIGLLP